MLHFFAHCIRLLLLILHGEALCHFVSASRNSRNGSLSPSAYPVSTASARALSIQPQQNSYNHSNNTTSKPSYAAKSLENPGKICFIEDCGNYSDATKTVDQYGGSNGVVPDADLELLCVLWNSSCPGNISVAMNDFFANNTGEILTANQCFLNQPTDPSEANNLEGCYKIESPQRLLQFGQAKEWMRSPQCLSDAALWQSSENLGIASQYLPHQDPGAGYCCSKCDLSVQNVDIYYWPEVDVDTSCLGIIGNTTNPLGYEATTTSATYDFLGRSSSTVIYSTYWGCVGQDSSITTTAYLTQINSITFKASSFNPWSSPPCPNEAPSSVTSVPSIVARGDHASIHARGHSLFIQPNVTQNNSLPISTLVLGNFTFTSPSIYANFHSISGDDGCGNPVVIPETMLTFSPGELSTIAGPLTDCGIDYCSFSTKAYNFRDLPCPPQSVMEENWYKPQPGEPYLPLIAMPKQIQDMNSFFQRCTNLFFTGFDPPRTLVPAAALSPTTTTHSPEAYSPAARPSPTPDPGAQKTTTSETPSITPADTPAMPQPQKPDFEPSHREKEASEPKSEPSDSRPPGVSPAQPGPNPEEKNSDPQPGSNANAEENPDQPIVPIQTNSAEVAHEEPNQNTKPASTNTPPPPAKANNLNEEPAESHGQAPPVDPQGTNNAADIEGNTGEENPSEIDPSGDATGDPRTEVPSNVDPSAGAVGSPNGENLSEVDPPGKVIGDPGKNNWDKIDPAVEINGDPLMENPSDLEPSVGGSEASSSSKHGPPGNVIGDPSEYNSNRIDPSVEVKGDPGQGSPSRLDPSEGGSNEESPSEVDQAAKPMADPEDENPNVINPSKEVPDQPGTEISNILDPTLQNTGDPETGNLSAEDPSFQGIGNPETGMPSTLDPSFQATGDSGPQSPSRPNSSFESTGDPGYDEPNQLDPSIDDTNITSETGENFSQQGDPNNPNESSQPNEAPPNLDPFRITPNQVLRIEDAFSLSAQQAQLPPMSAEQGYGAPDQYGSPSLYGLFDTSAQTETFSGSPPTPFPYFQPSSVNGHAITAIPATSSGPSRPSFPVTTPAMSMNGTVATPSTSVNPSDSSGSFASSGNSSSGAAKKSSTQSPNPLSPTETDSNAGKVLKSMSSNVRVADCKGWFVLMMLMFVRMG